MGGVGQQYVLLMVSSLTERRDVFHEQHVVNFQKGGVSVAVCSLMPPKPIIGGTPGLLVVHFLIGIFHRVHPDTVTRAKLLT